MKIICWNIGNFGLSTFIQGTTSAKTQHELLRGFTPIQGEHASKIYVLQWMSDIVVKENPDIFIVLEPHGSIGEDGATLLCLLVNTATGKPFRKMIYEKVAGVGNEHILAIYRENLALETDTLYLPWPKRNALRIDFDCPNQEPNSFTLIAVHSSGPGKGDPKGYAKDLFGRLNAVWKPPYQTPKTIILCGDFNCEVNDLEEQWKMVQPASPQISSAIFKVYIDVKTTLKKTYSEKTGYLASSYDHFISFTPQATVFRATAGVIDLVDELIQRYKDKKLTPGVARKYVWRSFSSQNHCHLPICLAWPSTSAATATTAAIRSSSTNASTVSG